MPIYEFCCQSCHDHFEELVSSSQSDGNGVVCPKCGGKSVSRLLSGFSFKSSGSSSASAGKSCGSCSSTSCSTCG